MVSLAEATRSFEMTADNVPEAHAVMLHQAAERIKAAARAYIGRDNAEWPPLADATQEQRARLGYTPDDPLLRSGALRDAIEAEVESHRTGGKAAVGVTDGFVGDGSKADPLRNIGDIAVWMELGTPDNAHPSPPRPFLTLGALEQKDAVEIAIVAGLRRLLRG